MDDSQEPVWRGADHTILREQEAEASTELVCHRYGISSTTFHKCKARYRGLECPTRQSKALENENRRLKKLLAEATLDVAALRTCGQNRARLQRGAWRRSG